jgi:hypothetical protein
MIPGKGIHRIRGFLLSFLVVVVVANMANVDEKWHKLPTFWRHCRAVSSPLGSLWVVRSNPAREHVCRVVVKKI